VGRYLVKCLAGGGLRVAELQLTSGVVRIEELSFRAAPLTVALAKGSEPAPVSQLERRAER